MQLFGVSIFKCINKAYPFVTSPYNYECCASCLLEIVHVTSLKNATQVSPSSGVVFNARPRHK